MSNIKTSVHFDDATVLLGNDKCSAIFHYLFNQYLENVKLKRAKPELIKCNLTKMEQPLMITRKTISGAMSVLSALHLITKEGSRVTINAPYFIKTLVVYAESGEKNKKLLTAFQYGDVNTVNKLCAHIQDWKKYIYPYVCSGSKNNYQKDTSADTEENKQTNDDNTFTKFIDTLISLDLNEIEMLYKIAKRMNKQASEKSDTTH